MLLSLYRVKLSENVQEKKGLRFMLLAKHELSVCLLFYQEYLNFPYKIIDNHWDKYFSWNVFIFI